MPTAEMSVVVGVGVGPLKFGATKQDVFSLIGDPDKISHRDEDDGELNAEYHYFNLRSRLQFEEEAQRLGWIYCDNHNLEIFGQKLFGCTKCDVLNLFKANGHTDPEFNDYGSFESYYFDAIEVELSFEYGVLNALNFGVLFDESGDVRLWPESQA